MTTPPPSPEHRPVLVVDYGAQYAQLIALGGVVPLLSFIVERRVHREAEADLAAHPEAAPRY